MHWFIIGLVLAAIVLAALSIAWRPPLHQVATIFLGVAMLIGLASCCSTRSLDTANDISIKCWEGPPCHCFVYDGDKVRDEVRSPGKVCPKPEYHTGVQ